MEEYIFKHGMTPVAVIVLQVVTGIVNVLIRLSYNESLEKHNQGVAVRISANLILYLIFSIPLTGCSVQQQALSSQFRSLSDPAVYVLDKEVIVTAAKTADTRLQASTEWSKVGEIEQGKVFKTRDQVVIVNSFNVHEGYIVVQDSNVVGYYLPVEGTFVKSEPIKIQLTRKEN